MLTILFKNYTERFFFYNSLFKEECFLKYTGSIKIQELGFLSEYYFITILFCITLFSLLSLTPTNNNQSLSTKFQYKNQLVFLFIFGLTLYLVLMLQQTPISLLSLISFNDTIHNDQLSLVSKLIITITNVLYLTFIAQYLKTQKLSNFEYYIILFTSIFGFFLLCGANDLTTAYLAIELQGLSFYLVASFKKSSNFSIESGVKYFVLGSLSTAIFLLGTTFIYGSSGSIISTDFKDFFMSIFSINSFFLSFDSIFKTLEIFKSYLCPSFFLNDQARCLLISIDVGIVSHFLIQFYGKSIFGFVMNHRQKIGNLFNGLAFLAVFPHIHSEDGVINLNNLFKSIREFLAHEEKNTCLLDQVILNSDQINGLYVIHEGLANKPDKDLLIYAVKASLIAKLTISDPTANLISYPDKEYGYSLHNTLDDAWIIQGLKLTGVNVISEPMPDFDFKKAFPYACDWSIEAFTKKSGEGFSPFTDQNKAFAIEAMYEYEGSRTVSQNIRGFIESLPIASSEDILENKKRKALEVFGEE